MRAKMDLTDISPARLEAASEWLVRLRQPDASQADMAAWLEWCGSERENLEAFDRMQDFCDGLRALKGADRDAFVELRQPGSLSTRPRSASVDQKKWKLGWMRPRVPQFAIAASLACALALVAIGWPRLSGLMHRQQQYETARGVNREVTLQDRSKVTLGAASAVSARYSKTKRQLVLEEGEAFFEVQPNRTRPFVVEAGPVTVTAVGTKFDIRRTRQRIVVTVTEGIVDVAPEGAAVPVRVHAGQRAIQSIDTQRLAVATSDASTTLAWKRGRLQYVTEPLSSVIEDVNRYAARPIVAEESALRGMIYSGTVFSERASEWALALRSVFPIRTAVREDGAVVISAASE